MTGNNQPRTGKNYLLLKTTPTWPKIDFSEIELWPYAQNPVFFTVNVDKKENKFHIAKTYV